MSGLGQRTATEGLVLAAAVTYPGRLSDCENQVAGEEESMPKKAPTEFVEQLALDPTFHKEFVAALAGASNESEARTRLLDFATARGYDVTLKELAAVAGEKTAALNDEQLSKVSGGLSISEYEDHLNSIGDDSQLANIDMQAVLARQQELLRMLGSIGDILNSTALAVIRKIA